MKTNEFEERFEKMSLDKTKKGYKIRINWKPLGAKLDKAQDALDSQVWEDVEKFMPINTGTLRSETGAINEQTRGKVYMYPPASEYGHYMWEGIVYEDPVYHKGGFLRSDGGFFSRPGVEKVPSKRKLKYKEPMAAAHWGEEAFKNHNKEWLEVVKRALK